MLDMRVDRAFSWRGRRDCAHFADAAIVAQTGVSIIGDLRWSSRRAARAIIEAEGGFEAAMDRRLRRIPPALAQRGDIAGVPDPLFGVRLMVVEGVTLVGPGAHGLERQPRSAMTIAWDTMSAGALDE
nr:hypothetical protein [Sphingopyxis sp. A083]